MDESHLQQVEVIISSMTAEERHRPGIINNSRRKRIARGSGTTVGDVNRLLKQFVQAQRMMKKMAKMAGETKKGGRGRRMFPF